MSQPTNNTPEQPPEPEPSPLPAGFIGAAAYGSPPATTVEPPQRPASPSNTPRRSKLPLIAIALVLIVAGAIAAVIARGSGGSKQASLPSRSPEATVQAFSDALSTADTTEFCRLLSKEQRQQISAAIGTGCIDSAGTFLTMAKAFGAVDLEVTGSSIESNTAVVAVVVNGESTEIPLVIENDRWVIDTSPTAIASVGEGTSGEGTQPSAPPSDPSDPSDSIGPDVSALCETDRLSVESAVEIYKALYGSPPASAQDLVDEGLLRELPALSAVEADGSVVPSGRCK